MSNRPFQQLDLKNLSLHLELEETLYMEPLLVFDRLLRIIEFVNLGKPSMVRSNHQGQGGKVFSIYDQV